MGELRVAERCLVGLGVVAVVMNVVLVVISARIVRRRLEVDLAIALAVVDMMLACIMAIGTCLMVVNDFDEDVMLAICRFKGPVDFAGLYLSMMLVALIGVFRYSHVFAVRIGRKLYLGLGVAGSMYSGLLVRCVMFDEFKVSPSGIDCAPDSDKSHWSRLLIFFNGVALLVFLLVTLACYLRIMFAVVQAPPRDGCFVEMKQGSLAGEAPPPSLLLRARIAIRPLTISTTYFILIAPACMLIIFEAVTFTGDYLKHTSLIVSLCLSNIALANPILILFAHTAIYNSAKQQCISFVKCFNNDYLLE
ncbi:hypothetical protein DSO57_1021582 [Entomophthora muscae]|uniref:Uncharacterized protein n=1 Tax=Entomophthora muscae TaxID=34485 RepID=A0ACC2TE70_9FUNG|nr:hypothetical protein DSO57_1021582 [Entomophthora muscae]